MTGEKPMCPPRPPYQFTFCIAKVVGAPFQVEGGSGSPLRQPVSVIDSGPAAAREQAVAKSLDAAVNQVVAEELPADTLAARPEAIAAALSGDQTAIAAALSTLVPEYSAAVPEIALAELAETE